MRGEQAIFNLEIKKKSGLSINLDIHHSKVFSSVHSLNGTQNLNFPGFSDRLFRFLQMPLNWSSYIQFC